MRTGLAYAAALAIGIATAVFVLWLGRETPIGTDLSFAGASVVWALAIVSALLARLAPTRWIAIALLLALPVCGLGIVMFALVASLGEYYWTWLWSALGAIVASLIGGYAIARNARRP